jgi:hypothetical protein
MTAAGRLGLEAGRLVEIERLALQGKSQKIYNLLAERASMPLLATVGSWHDTLDDETVLAHLKSINSFRPTP